MAIVGTVACSLVEMSANVTVAKLDDDNVVKDLLKKNSDFFKKSREELFRLADEDSQAFRKIVDAMHLPNQTDIQIADRDAELQKNYLRAALVPLEVMRVCREALDFAHEKVFDLLYKYVASDCKVGMELFENIIKNSMENVYANTRLMKDKALAQKIEERGKAFLAK